MKTQFSSSSIIFFILITLGGTAVHLSVLFFQLPVLQSLPYWFWFPHLTNIDTTWILLGAATIVTAAIISKLNIEDWLKIILIIAAGANLQFTLAYSKGHGIDGIRDRMVSTGHAQFSEIAPKIDNAFHLIENYENMVSAGTLGTFAPSKPPGTLLIYVAHDRIASFFSSRDKTQSERTDAIRDIAAYTWPILTYLAIPFIFLLGKRLIGTDHAITASLLYISVPSVNLITMHTDQAIYPIISAAFLYLSIAATTDNNRVYAFASGIVLFMALFLSFGMLPLAIIAAIMILLGPVNISSKATHAFLAMLGFFAAELIAYACCGYDPVERYNNAIQWHENWKGWDGTIQTTVKAGLTNLIEFCTWTGISIALLFMFSLSTSISHSSKSKLQYIFLFTASIALTFLLLAILGKTKAESARLWMFLTPFVCISAAHAIQTLSCNSRHLHSALLALIVLLQLGTNVAILRFQDFF